MAKVEKCSVIANQEGFSKKKRASTTAIALWNLTQRKLFLSALSKVDWNNIDEDVVVSFSNSELIQLLNKSDLYDADTVVGRVRSEIAYLTKQSNFYISNFKGRYSYNGSLIRSEYTEELVSYFEINANFLRIFKETVLSLNENKILNLLGICSEENNSSDLMTTLFNELEKDWNATEDKNFKQFTISVQELLDILGLNRDDFMKIGIKSGKALGFDSGRFEDEVLLPIIKELFKYKRIELAEVEDAQLFKLEKKTVGEQIGEYTLEYQILSEEEIVKYEADVKKLSEKIFKNIRKVL